MAYCIQNNERHSTPDGMIAHVFGPYPGRLGVHDIISNDNRFNGYLIYGDPAYGRDSVTHCPYGGPRSMMSEQRRAVNESMSRVRVSVEWMYGLVIQ